jgi:VWFA-related protein
MGAVLPHLIFCERIDQSKLNCKNMNKWITYSGIVKSLALAFLVSLAFASSRVGSRATPSDRPRDSDARVSIPVRARPPLSKQARSNIQVDVNLVLIPATVTDPNGIPVSGLRSDAFRLFEDGIEQRIRYFAKQDAPISMGLVLDASRSMEYKLQTARTAVSKFLLTSMPGDEYFLIEFNNHPQLLQDFTPDIREIEDALPQVKANGWTSLLDAIYLAINRMRHAANSRKALLVLSDGGDNNSRYTKNEIRSIIREADVCIYTIGMLGPGLSKRNIRLLTELAENTGGSLYTTAKLDDLPDTMRRISVALRNQYLLGYVPTNSAEDGLYRKIEVRLAQPAHFPPLRASWRVGYYAPAGQ